MTVYVDDMRAAYGRMKMCHMVADSTVELLEMADKIGVARKWFQLGSHPHFDISMSKRALAIKNGAVLVDRYGLVAAIKRHRQETADNPDELSAVKAAYAATRTHVA